MSMTRLARGRAALLLTVTAVGVLLILAGVLDVAHAQGSPFGVGRPSAAQPVPVSGIAGWIIAKQAEFYRTLSGMIRAAKADGTAVWGLLGVSFAYGIFHAAGPGHGKAVISSYLIANEETWRRGVALSFASALFQALTAVAIVGVAAVLLNATAATMSRAVNWIETASYALIVLIGLRLMWVKGRSFFSTWRKLRAAETSAGTVHAAHDHAQEGGVHENPAGHDPVGHDHAVHRHAGHDHAHAHHGHAHAHDADAHVHTASCGHHHHGHDHDDHASAWGHAHGPEPEELAGPGGWRRGLSAIVAVGLRPCSGAIIVLVFALAQGLLWAGVAATFVMGLGTAITVTAIATMAVGAKAFARRIAAHRTGYGGLALRGLEVAASVAVVLFGAALLAGYMVSERMVGI